MESERLLDGDEPAVNEGGGITDAEARNNKRRRTAIIIVSVIISLLTITVAVTLGVSLAQTAAAVPLLDTVRTENIFTHLNEFYSIALNAGVDRVPSRAVRYGYNKSAEYIIDVLEANGVCTPRMEHFTAPVHEINAVATLQQTSPKTITYQNLVDFQQMRYGGVGTGQAIIGQVQALAEGATGCSAADYAGIIADSFVLVPAPNTTVCTTYDQAKYAQEANAAGLLQYLTAPGALSNVRVRTVDWVEGDTVITIPTFSISYALGQTFRADLVTGPLNLALSVNATHTIENTFNVICDTGSAGNTQVTDVVVVGAHLDGVPEGPGINDNGSGSATILEIALQFAKLGLANAAINPVRFCWWGAEEIGLLGSRYHVRQAKANNDILRYALYLNYDMLGSPNYVIQVHKGTLVNAVVPVETRQRSTVIQSIFEQYLNATRQPYEFAAMTGGSDYLPFLEDGDVPSGGLATGASSIKTTVQRDIFGGVARAQLDPCYHQDCDDVGNVSEAALKITSETASYVLQFLSAQADLRTFLQGGAPIWA